MRLIERVAVLGAGTMGARIAAHLANAGVPSFLLDVVPPEADGEARNRIAKSGLDAAVKSQPAAFFEPALAKLITIGNFDDNLNLVAQADWVIEAVVEDLEIKRSLLRKVDAGRRAGTIITTNTSGLPVSSIAQGFSEDFRRHWFGTHFFNPPRYMRLLEIIPTPASDRDAMAAIARFCDVRLGKGIVQAKDTPNFIANRIGTFSVLNVMRLMQEMDLSIEEVDALTGTAVGWPKSATFRTADLVGLDVLGHVVGNMMRNVQDERSDLRLPEFVPRMLERKWLGDKTGGGFYKKIKVDGKDERLALDWKTMEYHPRQKAHFPALEMAKNVESTPARLRMLLGLDGAPPQKNDKAGQFLWAALADLWNYAANRVPEISDSIVEIDRGMRLGFNWELGPFELWDAAGVEATVARMKQQGMTVAPNVEKLLASGKKSWYVDQPAAASGRAYFDLGAAAYQDVVVPAGVWSVEVAKKARPAVKKNAGASLVDLGDGVACIEFHSKMNALGGDIIQMVTQALKPGGPGDAFDAFVITNDASNFSVGANLMLLLMAVQEEEWDEINLIVRAFQQMTQAIKFSAKPVVLAPFGMALGGGCEVSLHGAARQPHAELYMGLVEVGVGLLPAGGGCKEMLLRALDSAAGVRPEGRSESVEVTEAVKRAFETIAMAKVSTSANEARNLGFLSDGDQVTMNRDRVLTDAKTRALELAQAGYQPPRMRTDLAAPGESILALLKLGIHLMHEGEYITDYEVKIGTKVAEVLCGGNVTPGTPVSEQYLLDLEREAFLSLCGERKTQERIQYTLKTGKPLRN
jgi:3-hydroxyacyl-CoA dehydrogenase